MRLLKRSQGGDFQLISFNDDDLPPYAILSHTWTEGQEVTYNELVAGVGKSKTGYDKIRFCMDKAAEDDLEYSWVDTCCIDKSTSDELSTALNSMFRWYQSARKCFVYLSDVRVPDEVTDPPSFQITWKHAFRHSRWFSRGWTLQELLAPPTVEFFSREGKRLGSKISLERDIHEITKVPIEALRGKRLADFSVSERMSWAANRRTRLKEDKAYSLMGIFEVFMPLIYGEGEDNALKRLRREVDQDGAQSSHIHPQPNSAVSAIEDIYVLLMASSFCLAEELKFVEICTGVKPRETTFTRAPEIFVFEKSAFQRFHLVTLPPLPKGDASITERLESYATFLNAFRSKSIKFSGLVFLHSGAFDTKVDEPMFFSAMCGAGNLQASVIALAKQQLRADEETDGGIYEERQKYTSVDERLKPLLEHGAKVYPFSFNKASATRLLDTLLLTGRKFHLAITEELRECDGFICRTTAGTIFVNSHAERRAKWELRVQEEQTEVLSPISAESRKRRVEFCRLKIAQMDSEMRRIQTARIST